MIADKKFTEPKFRDGRFVGSSLICLALLVLEFIVILMMCGGDAFATIFGMICCVLLWLILVSSAEPNLPDFRLSDIAHVLACLTILLTLTNGIYFLMVVTGKVVAAESTLVVLPFIQLLGLTCSSAASHLKQ